LFTLSLESELQPTNNANHNSDEPMGPSAFLIQPPEVGSVSHGRNGVGIKAGINSTKQKNPI
jgi:hypothetical protein